MTATIAMFIDPIFWLMVFIMVGVPAIAVYLGIRASKRHSVAKAGWYLDPTARHAYRFWDGRAWTSHVADGGQVAVDSFIPVPS